VRYYIEPGNRFSLSRYLLRKPILIGIKSDRLIKAGPETASRSLNVLITDSPLHRKCRELLIAAD
jgi:hypothetical protein